MSEHIDNPNYSPRNAHADNEQYTKLIGQKALQLVNPKSLVAAASNEKLSTSRRQRVGAWITEQAIMSLTHSEENDLPEIRISRHAAALDGYQPNTAVFPNTRIADSLFHPVDHLARVLVWSDVIANQLTAVQQDNIDRPVLRAAASLHDIGRGGFRLNPHVHGQIAAAIVRDRSKLAQLMPDGPVHELDNEQIENIAYLIESHHQFDHASGSVRPDMDLTLSVLQTADGLDLTRGNFLLGGPISLITDRTSIIDDTLPIVKHTLRTPSASKLRAIASRYATKTQREIRLFNQNRFTTSLDIAEQMNIITP
jgi:hypothetical protein